MGATSLRQYLMSFGANQILTFPLSEVDIYRRRRYHRHRSLSNQVPEKIICRNVFSQTPEHHLPRGSWTAETYLSITSKT